MKALVIAERSETAADLCAGARSIADDVVFVAIGARDVPEGIADNVIRIALPEDAVFEDAAETVKTLFDREAPDVVLIEPTRRLRIVAGRLSYHAGTAAVTDVVEFDDGLPVSLYFGGIAHRKSKAIAGTPIYLVGAGVFSDGKAEGANIVEDAAWVAPANPVRRVAGTAIEKSGADLTKADCVVAAGRGFAEESELDLARDLCSKVGGELGCTRPLTEGVDWLPRETYIGVSGLLLAPHVYIGCGVSGQMQHMVGVNRAGVVFAVNKDKNAPIFKQCDYGLVGDLKTVIPELIAAL